VDVKQVLQEYGLSDKETNVYLELLPSGNITLQKISGKLDYPRTTVYNTLNYLINKGLVSFITKNGTRFYAAVDPEKLVDKLDEKRALIKSVMPNLKVLRETIKDSSSVEIFQGSKGVFTILSDIFKTKQEIYYFGSYSLSKEVLKYQPEHVRTLRLERKIPAKIVIDPYDEQTFHTKEYKKITEMRFNKSLKDFPCMIFIYGNKVAMYTLKKELIGIIIHNEQVAESMKILFDIYWSNSKPAKL
jgi:sugar-specific transcriptional regulator TrmB